MTDAGEGVWRPGAKIWNYSGVRTDIDNLVGKGGNLAFTVSFEQTSNDVWKESGFQSMLDYINKYIREGKLIVTDFETARSCHMETAEEAEGLSQELKERKETLEKEIEELEKQIDEIYQ